MKRFINISDDYTDLTKGNYYDILDTKPSRFEWKSDPEKVLVKNDLGEEKWYDFNTYIIEFATVFENEFVIYKGDRPYKGLTKDKLYQLCGRIDSRYFYFVDDYNNYVGIPIYNFDNSSAYFKSLVRNNTIDNILK
jgi:hypothetical protein